MLGVLFFWQNFGERTQSIPKICAFVHLSTQSIPIISAICAAKVFLKTFGRPKYTYKTWEKSKIGNKRCRASKFSISGHHYTDVVDVDSISGAAASVGVCLSLVCLFPLFFSFSIQKASFESLAFLCKTFFQYTFSVNKLKFAKILKFRFFSKELFIRLKYKIYQPN